MKTSKPSYSPRTFGETTFTYRGTDRTPVKVQRKHDRNVHNGDRVSTPKNYVQALAANGNDRRSRTPIIPNSILATPESRRKKTPKKALHVSFELSPHHEHSVVGDDHRRRSLLGYDWIAGLLDNTSFLSDKPDDFFEDLKEFRRVNKDDCYGRALNEKPYSPLKITPSKHHQNESAEGVSCDNAYTLNDRLFPVPIHGPDMSCSVCDTKRHSEYETEGSYVRISVPRSSLLSPYKVKPHRRASFDPTDSVGLSSHCLAGWESSKPRVIPMPSSLDLRASLHQSRTTLDASRAGLFPRASKDTQDLLDRSHSMRYGLQMMERERRTHPQPPHTTPYPLL